MPTHDPAKIIKDALPVHFAATLHVDDDWTPTTDTPVALLVANDGGPAITPGPWILHAPDYNPPDNPYKRGTIRRPLLRLTAFAKGRTTARECVDAAVDWLLDNNPMGIARIDDVSDILITRDPGTGNFLASVIMPVIVRPKPVVV